MAGKIMSSHLDRASIIEQTRQRERRNRSSTEVLIKTLLDIEKESKKHKETVSFERLLGTWRLQFITGTKKARDRAGIVLGAGRYLPPWLDISIAYTRNTEPETGTILNQVVFGALQLTVSGPAKFYPRQRILAFDFTRMTLTIWGISLYSGYIRGGEKSEAHFHEDSLKKQAFFAYFMIEEKAIAARGRGGGLALWVRE
jgi:hypothetical protein